MAVPETLCHPFATAKIVVSPATCSVRDGLIIAARSGDAALCACGRRGERTGNRCDRDKGSKCFPHSRPSCACMACALATAVPSMMPRNSRRYMSPQRPIVSGQLSALIGGQLRAGRWSHRDRAAQGDDPLRHIRRLSRLALEKISLPLRANDAAGLRAGLF